MATITPEQLQKMIGDLKKAFSEMKGYAEAAGIKTLEGDIKRRVFNKGQGTDKPLGPYKSKAYKKIRTDRGNQVGYKDLEFTGDMRKTLVMGESEGHAALGFTLRLSAKKADWQEEQLNMYIWRPNKQEMKRMLKAITTTINKKLIEALS